MGRGRQKAKHMKVARKLKYFSPDTDFDSLERELAGIKEPDPSGSDPDDEDRYYDAWADSDD